MEVRASVLVPREPGEVFDFVAQPSNDHRWRSYLVSSSGRPTGVGDRVVQTYSYQGQRQTVELRVTEFVRAERLTYSITVPARGRISFGFRPEDGGTRVSMSISATVSGPAALFSGRIEAEATRLVRTDLDRLKDVLESVE